MDSRFDRKNTLNANKQQENESVETRLQAEVFGAQL
jgi:hypothetical protein